MLRPTDMTFPTVAASFMVSLVFLGLLIGCGWWTAYRHSGYSAKRCGTATMRMSLIGGIPVQVAGVLLAADVITATQVGLGVPPMSLAVIVAPLARLPEAWLYGWMGAADSADALDCASPRETAQLPTSQGESLGS